MNGFSKLHPVVQLAFFIASLIIIISVNSPFFSVIALFCVLFYSFCLNKNDFKNDIKLTIFCILTVGIFNMLFAHYGVDVLFKIKTIEFTLETLCYGLNQGAVLSVVIIQFSQFSKAFDSERIIYIFKFSPKLALVFSMVLGFIPRFKTKLKDISESQKALYGGDVSNKNFKDKINNAIKNLSALITYSLESSVITSNSMRARNYNPKAVRYGRFKWKKEDVIVLIFVIVSFAIVLTLMLLSKIKFIFDPVLYSENNSILAICMFTLLELTPIVIEFTEKLLWKKSSAKI